MRRPHVRGAASAGVAALALLAASGTSIAGASFAGAPSSRIGAHTTVPRTGTLTTYDWGNARYGEDPYPTAIRSLSANPRWDKSLDGAVYGQPLVDDGVVYVATEGDSVYALNATTGAERWRVHVGNPVPVSTVDTAPTLGGGCGDIDPLGITGTPVIDPARNELFAAEETLVGGNAWQNIRHWLVAVDLTTHRELWHRSIDPPDGNQASHYYIAAEQQRPAMTLLDGRLYVEFGGLSGDCGQYHGYVVGVDEARTGGFVSYQVPSQREAGIWGTGGAVVPPAGNLYVATGNGSSNSLAHFDEGNAVVELSPALRRLGYWAPSDWVDLNEQDWDLGSASPVAVPDTTLLFAAGKPADAGNVGYLMRDGRLGGIGKGAFHGFVCPSGGAFGADATDVVTAGRGKGTYVYVPCGSGTEALLVHTTSPISFHEVWSPSTGSPNGPPIVAGGLVWALDWNGNELEGMNPVTGHVAYARSTDGLNHFATPGFGDGMLVIPTAGGVEAFGAG
jgi:polyvinyl alcohol dehydrogenase (cytochrome)